MRTVDVRLYGVVDPERVRNDSLPDAIEQAITGGVTCLQYRDKRLDVDDRLKIATIRELLRQTAQRVPFLINDRVDFALAAGADGVHLGSRDMLPQDARRLLGSEAIIGTSAGLDVSAEFLRNAPLDYCCIGPVFATSSKETGAPLHPEGLKSRYEKLRAQLCVPIGAIGGITPANIQAVLAAGVQGVAVISALFQKENVFDATKKMRAAIDSF